MGILEARVKLADDMRKAYWKKESAEYDLYHGGKWSDVNDTDLMELKFDVAQVEFDTACMLYHDHVIEEGILPAYAWPGGGNIVYYDKDGNALCADCGHSELSDPSELYPLIEGSEIYEEGPTIQCERCNKDIESAYGDPEEETIGA